LAPRTAKLEHHDIAAPGFGRGPGCDVVNGTADWCPPSEGSRRIKYVKWKAQELAAQVLREDDAVGWRIKKWLKQRDRTEAVGGAVWWAALYGDDFGSVWDKKSARAICGIKFTHPHLRGIIWQRSKCSRALLRAALRSCSSHTEPKGDSVRGGVASPVG
jgi:hypothetical protein